MRGDNAVDLPGAGRRCGSARRTGPGEQLRDAMPQLEIVCNCGGGSLKARFKQTQTTRWRAYALVIGDSEIEAGTVALKPLRAGRFAGGGGTRKRDRDFERADRRLKQARTKSGEKLMSTLPDRTKNRSGDKAMVEGKRQIGDRRRRARFRGHRRLEAGRIPAESG